jgi:hypothetical protein
VRFPLSLVRLTRDTTDDTEAAVMKRKIVVALLAGALALSSAGSALAGSFGPGNSDKGVHDPGAKCHPPGQTVGEGGCK